MTMRTSRHFICPNGHKGEEQTSENDQPYSKSWEQVTASGMSESGKDSRGYPTYLCSQCGHPMTPFSKKAS